MMTDVCVKNIYSAFMQTFKGLLCQKHTNQDGNASCPNSDMLSWEIIRGTNVLFWIASHGEDAWGSMNQLRLTKILLANKDAAVVRVNVWFPEPLRGVSRHHRVSNHLSKYTLSWPCCWVWGRCFYLVGLVLSHRKLRGGWPTARCLLTLSVCLMSQSYHDDRRWQTTHQLAVLLDTRTLCHAIFRAVLRIKSLLHNLCIIQVSKLRISNNVVSWN